MNFNVHFIVYLIFFNVGAWGRNSNVAKCTKFTYYAGWCGIIDRFLDLNKWFLYISIQKPNDMPFDF